MTRTRTLPRAKSTPETRSDGLGASAHQRIREAIATGIFKPGQRITETQLAEWLSISRTPVREAVQRLLTQGLLSQSAGQGLTVTKLDYQAIVELYAMREVLESAAARSAAMQATEPEIEILEDILEMERKVVPGVPADAAHYNRQFHQALGRAAHNRYLLASQGALEDAMALLGNTTLAMDGRHAEAVEEHARIVAAIRERKPEAAAQAISDHIRAAQRKRLKMLLSAREE
jgi:DNA-binding GntR family transcriptional regulator